MFSETIGLFGLAQDVKTRQRNPTVPKIDMGMAMMIADALAPEKTLFHLPPLVSS